MPSGAATTATMSSYHTEDSWAGSGMLASSTGSLASSRHQTSLIAKTYRQATNLFLTRRLPEALSTLEAIILPDNQENGATEGHAGGLAPVASASRGSRIKVWRFYLTFLNAVVELGPEEGKHAFGSVRWKQLVNKARDGTVWEDIVQSGYGGNEGSVDAEVVADLATLILAHSPSQGLNQQRLEAYFAAMSHPSFDIAAHLSSSHSQGRFARRPSAASGANTPRDLNTQIKLLEIYTLHVLPRNGEWDYAREFIMMSEVLDDERKEAFLQGLHGYKEQMEQTANRERELQKLQREELEEQRRAQVEEERRRTEEEARRKAAPRPPDTGSPTSAGSRGKLNGTARPDSNRPSRAIPPSNKKNTQISSPSSQNSRSKNPVPRTPQTLYKRAAAIFSSLQSLLLNMGQSMTGNPMAMMRMILFLLMFALAFGRKDIRERVRRMMAKAWEKVGATVGMGTKVSYI